LDSEIKAGHWYIDQKGCKKLYLGVAQQIYGPPYCTYTHVHQPAYLYAKYDELEKHFSVDPNTIPIREIADEILFKLNNYTHPAPYYGYNGHHKFLSECGAHPDGKIAPEVLENPEYTFKIAFYDTFEEAKPEGRYLSNGAFIDNRAWLAMHIEG
jgi:hypothetical protein